MFPLKSQRQSTAFSEFIRTASAAEKKKLYVRVLRKAIDSQNELIARALRRKFAD